MRSGSPIYPSPMADFGYDIVDYCGIGPRFGTLADFDDLLAQAHARGLKVLLEFVPNCCAPGLPQTSASRALPVHPWSRSLAAARQRGDCRPKICRSYD